MKFVIYNGEVLNKQELNLTDLVLKNSFTISQKIWFGYGGIPLLKENIDSLEKQLESFNRKLPELFYEQRELFRLCKRMLNKNRFYLSGWIHIQLFVQDSEVEFLISSEASQHTGFPINGKGLLVGFSPVKNCLETTFSGLKCHHQLLWESILSISSQQNYDNLLILNKNDFVSEAISANLFMLKNEVLITPALQTGCYMDTMRSLVIEAAQKANLEVVEVENLEEKHLLEMDEIFMISEEKGMDWVLGIGSKRFIQKHASELILELNRFLKKRI